MGNIREIRMSIEDTRLLDGQICSQILSNMAEEFERQEYLQERYTRSKELREIRKEENPVKMDIICSYEKYMTDVAVGYSMGKQPTYYNKERQRISKRKTAFGIEKPVIEEFEEKVSNETKGDSNELLEMITDIQEDNHDHKENIRLTRRAFITSNAFELIYTDEEGKIKYKMVNGRCAIIKSNDIESKTIGFLRTYKDNSMSFENGILNTVQYDIIELYTHFKRVKYSSRDNFESEENLWKGDVKPFMEHWEIPVVSIEMPYKLGLFEQQVSQIRGYELVTNNTKKILNYNDDAILMISGVMFLNGDSEEEVNRVIERFRTQGVIFTGDKEQGGGAQWLTKTVNDTTNQAHKDNLKNDLYAITGLFNPENDSAVYQNTLSLVFKLYGLETKISEYEEIFKDAMKRRIKIITQIINETSDRKYDWRDIDLTMFRNLPTNTNEELNFVNQAREILPLEKIYDELSFVTDSKEMLRKYEDDKIREAKLEAEIAKIMAEATVTDMQSDNPYIDYTDNGTDENISTNDSNTIVKETDNNGENV